MSRILKNIVLILILLAVVAFGYYFFTKSVTNPDTAAEDADITRKAEEIGADMTKVDRYKLDVSVLKDARLTSLKNTRIDLPTQNSGRPNPFAPLP